MSARASSAGRRSAPGALLSLSRLLTREKASHADHSWTTGSISGVVTGAADGSPLEGVAVRAALPGTGMSASVRTAADGSYTIEGLVAEGWTVSFAHESSDWIGQYWNGAAEPWRGSPVRVVAGETVPGIDAALQAGGFLAGSVRRAADGAPVRGSVTARGASGSFRAAIRDDGSYLLQVRPGEYTVFFDSLDPLTCNEYWPGVVAAGNAIPVVVAAGSAMHGLDARLASTATITGTIRAGGAPCPTACVEAWTDGERVALAWARKDGSYRLTVPEGTYSLVARGGRLPAVAAPYSGRTAAAGAASLVATVAGVPCRADFDLDPSPPTVVLSSSTVRPGDAVEVTGSGFPGGERVTVTLDEALTLATVEAGEGGIVSAAAVIPADTEAGEHVIGLTGSFSGVAGSARVTVVSPDEESVPTPAAHA
ncbi:carboxypeptidase-like regulatory domain-containing protein [Microbacterium capsulatum]|uniref:Carboxypeptidase-like regulatory domain-containing protein n=1 Tax=Microbacterium capsulatum TaxID=3041921 RepID=A0ABU0XE87_9MICO|nr:carboxypeptidase-like regulatory domain-containing protein [Microbacterium sp. ASV81]MDQ4213430.1 carboxypeptidase-like regulatory domain-containing protein [Microbacterium sp. ASV81]